jgi:hypothetical protein
MSRKTKIFIFICTIALSSYFNFLNASDIEFPIYREGISHSAYYNSNLAPIEDRDERFIEFLSQSVKINSNGSSGSGTIIYYDYSTKYAYVISCGHLWKNNKFFDEKENHPKAKIVTWYKNSKKLENFETYEAEILFWSNDRGYDVSCLKFKPDWIPNYISVSDIKYEFTKNLKLNSLGCDGGKEVARYEVEFRSMNPPDIITSLNSPRPGRSGGGLITNTGLFVGICWGTSDTTSGNGIGYFTPMNSIYHVFDKNKHRWILESSQGTPVQKIPIYDWNDYNKTYDKNFIPIPLKIKIK